MGQPANIGIQKNQGRRYDSNLVATIDDIHVLLTSLQ